MEKANVKNILQQQIETLLIHDLPIVLEHIQSSHSAKRMSAEVATGLNTNRNYNNRARHAKIYIFFYFSRNRQDINLELLLRGQCRCHDDYGLAEQACRRANQKNNRVRCPRR